MKTLDAKLAAIHADPGGSQAFILADAKDADMAFGLAAPGTDPLTGRPRSLEDYRDQMREIARQGLRQQVAELALLGAGQILMREVDRKAHNDVLNKISASL